MLHWWRGLAERIGARTLGSQGQETMAADFRAVGGCRCDAEPVRYQFTRRPLETHFCCCTDCTAVCGGALALIALVERHAFKVTAGASKIRTFATKPTCHRRFCSACGCHMFFEVDAVPTFVLVHAPTVDRDSDVGTPPDRWVFTRSRHPLLVIPDDGLPRHPGWADAPHAR